MFGLPADPGQRARRSAVVRGTMSVKSGRDITFAAAKRATKSGRDVVGQVQRWQDVVVGPLGRGRDVGAERVRR